MTGSILHLTEATGWTGGSARLLELAAGLQRRGWRVWLGARSGQVADTARRRGLEVVPFAMRQDYDVLTAWSMARFIAENKVDVVHAHHPRAHAVAVLAKAVLKLTGRRLPLLVVSRRVSYKVGQNPFSRWKYTTRLIDAYVAVAGAVADLLADAGVDRERLHVVLSGLDPEVYRPRAPKPELLRELGGAGPFIGKIANFAAAKGQSVFLEAAKRVLARRPEARFVLAGRATDSEEVRRLVAAQGLEGKVALLGFREDVPELVPCFSVSVNAAVGGEGLSGAMRESLAMEVPVVASDLAGNRELVEEGVTGRLVPPGDAAALAEAVLWTLDNPEKAKAMARRGRQVVLERFGLDKMIDGTEALYVRLLTGGRLAATVRS